MYSLHISMKVFKISYNKLLIVSHGFLLATLQISTYKMPINTCLLSL